VAPTQASNYSLLKAGAVADPATASQRPAFVTGVAIDGIIVSLTSGCFRASLAFLKLNESGSGS